MSLATATTSSNNPDTLDVLLKKAKAICTVNGESLDFIKSRKGQQVITHRKYILKPKRRKISGQGTIYSGGSIENELAFASQDTKVDVNTIIDQWKYTGDPLKKQIIAINDFINIKLNVFEDLARIQNDYESLIEVYLRVLVDQPESRAAVIVVLENVEILQVAIGEIHEQIIDKRNDIEGNEVIESFVSLFSKGIQKIWDSGVKFSMNLSEITEGKDTEIAEFKDVTKISCKHTLTTTGSILWIEPCIIDDAPYLISSSGGKDKKVQLWNMRDFSHAGTFIGNEVYIFSLAFFNHNGIDMLAGGGIDGKILLWDVTTKSIMHTLSDHTKQVCGLQIYENKDKRMYLISGSEDGKLIVWDLCTFSAAKTVECEMGEINTINLFSKNDQDYIAVGTDEGVGIWCLNNYTKVVELDASHEYCLLALTYYEGILMLAGGAGNGQVTIWNLDDYQPMETYTHHKGTIWGLEWITSNENICLVSGASDGYMKVWDMEGKAIISTTNIESGMNSVHAMERNGIGCILTGDDRGNIKVWEESLSSSLRN